jgi:hypothetical protein
MSFSLYYDNLEKCIRISVAREWSEVVKGGRAGAGIGPSQKKSRSKAPLGAFYKV